MDFGDLAAMARRARCADGRGSSGRGDAWLAIGVLAGFRSQMPSAFPHLAAAAYAEAPSPYHAATASTPMATGIPRPDEPRPSAPAPDAPWCEIAEVHRPRRYFVPWKKQAEKRNQHPPSRHVFRRRTA